ncbi:MAG: hypothetical protein ACR2PH_15180 [Desulfobulbia bacterium]
MSTVTEAENEPIQPDDFVIVKGAVQNCEDWGEFTIQLAQVIPEGLRVFEYLHEAVGVTHHTIQDALRVELYIKHGRFPKTLRVDVLSPEEFQERQVEILNEIEVFHSAVEACNKKIEHFRESSKDVAKANMQAHQTPC